MTATIKPEGRWITGGKIDGCKRSIAWLHKEGFTAAKSEQYVAWINHKVDQEAQNLADRLEAEMDGRPDDVRPWSALAATAAEKLRQLGAGPFLGHGGHSVDLFGFMDVVAYSDTVIIAVQATSRAKIAKHLRDYRRDEEVREDILRWIAAPSRAFVIHGWARQEIPNAKGSGTHKLWRVEQRWVTAADLEEKVF